MRYLFGLDGGSNVVDAFGNKLERTCTIWNARTGGTQVTDLQSPSGSAYPGGVVTQQTNGSVGFLGPDGDDGPMWADFGDGTRWHIPLVSVTDVMLALIASNAIAASQLGAPSGIATLDSSARLTSTQLPLEALQDAVADMLNTTHDGITFTYNDATGKLVADVTVEGGTGATPTAPYNPFRRYVNNQWEVRGTEFPDMPRIWVAPLTSIPDPLENSTYFKAGVDILLKASA